MKNNYLQSDRGISSLVRNGLQKGMTFFVLAIMLIITMGAKANPVDAERARLVAKTFLNNNGARSTGLTDITAEVGFDNVYVFTTANSFVILAADDCERPILGYSINGGFDLENMPENKAAWIQEYSDGIRYAIDHQMRASTEVLQLWNDLAAGRPNAGRAVTVVSPLVQTHWDQGNPYNLLCPSNSVTGCVATAMAQVMKYWNYPEHGIGTHSYVHYNYGELSADFQSTTYDWTNMLNSYSGSSTQTQKMAVATLMYHCGVSVDMDYSPSGSGAVTAQVADALKTYFNYSSQTQHHSRSEYDDNTWVAMLKADLDLNYPIQYHGSGSGGGHSFVFDGYNSSNYFHVNWGWGGYCDEYYQVSNLNPGPGGIGSGSNGIYNDDQGAIFHAHPSECVADAPTNLTYTQNNRSITLNWNTASGAASYNVYRNNNFVANVTTNTYTDTAPFGSSVYYVRSVDAAGELSLSSNAVTVSVGYSVPVVDNLAANVTGNNVGLTWTAPDWCYPETPTATLNYGDGSVYFSWTYTYYAHRYLASDLATYAGKAVYKVSTLVQYPGDYTVYVYTNSNGNQPMASSLAVTKSIHCSSSNLWLDFDFDEPIILSGNTDLWVVMKQQNTGASYPTPSFNLSSHNTNAFYAGNTSPTSLYDGNSSYNCAWFINTFLTDGEYTYNLYRNGTCIANSISNTYYNDENLTPDTYEYYLKTNYYAGESPASNHVIAQIGVNYFDITATANPTEGGTITGAGAYPEGASCTLVATANEGYTFTNWTKNGTVVSTSANYSFTVTEGGNYVANFSLNSYDITASANPTAGGTVTGGGTYDHSATCNLVATANTGYTFVNWTKNGTVVSTTANYSFTVTEGGNYVANFSLNSYDITASANPTAGGTVTGGGTYDHGATCNLVATANTGYTFVNWTKNGTVVSTTANYSFTVTEGGNYVANFSLNSYEITASCNPIGAGTITGTGNYDYGASCTLSVTPNPGYTFTNWTKNGTVVSTTQSFNFTVTENATYVANFSVNGYEITASANPAEGGTITGTGAYTYGTSVTLVATANEGYTFLNWTQNGTVVSTNTSYTLTVTESTAFVANFQINSYDITASANPTAGGSVTGGGSYNHGATCNLVATANTGYTFVNWTKNGTVISTSANYSFTVTEGGNYVANFSLNNYDITASCNPTGAGTITGTGNYDYGASCTLSVTPNPGYTFVNWTKNGTIVSTSSSFNFTVTENATYVANFSVNGYEITATANPAEGGTITGTGAYTYGTSVTLVATANEGYTFLNWTQNGTVVSTNTSYTLTVTESAAFVANFQINSYEITTTLNPTIGGTVTGGGTYDHGATCNLVATANTGYTFVNWTKNGTVVSTSANFSFTVTEGGNYVANFSLNSYEITASCNPTGAGTIIGTGTYNHGASCTLSVTPNPGHTFINWTKDGTVVSTNLSFSFTVTEEAAYVANFSVNNYDITTSANPSIGGSTTGDGTYAYGSTCNLVATPTTGYHFVNWTKNGTVVSTNANYSFTVTEGGNYVANFQINSYEITATANPTAGGSVTGSGTYNHGTSCTLTASVNTGYTFVNWTKNGTVVSTSLSFSFTVTETATYVANYQINSYDITASANPTAGGSVTGDGNYNYGATCNLVATANTGYTFVNWTKNGTVVSTNASYSFTVTESADYVANFQINSYDITVAANPTAGGTVTGDGTYDHGATCNLVATANTGYTFVNWTKNGTVVSTSANFSFTVTEGGNYVANFSLNSYEITASCNPTGAGTIIGTGTYNHGASCTLSVTPNPGHTFINWTKDGTVVSTSLSFSFTVTEEAAYVANFSVNNYDITTSANPSIGGSTTGDGTYAFGSTCNLVATPTTGYHFLNWSKNGTVVSTNANYSFTVTEGGNYVANFQINSYEITATANPTAGGSVTGGGTYNHGASCTLTASTNTGYTFINWTKNGTVVSTNLSFSFTVTETATYVANYQINSYDITASTNPAIGGTVTGDGTYNYGSTCLLNATASEGYTFVNWTKNGSVVSTSPAYSFTVTESADFIANFSLNSYQITAVANPTNAGTVDGDGTYNHFETCTLTATPDPNYLFLNWTKDGVVVSTSASYSFTVVEAGNYVANFVPNEFQITATATPSQGGTVTGSGVYNYGTTATLTATPNTGFHFVNWTKNGAVVSTSSTYSFTVLEAGTYVAHFDYDDCDITTSADPTVGGTTTGDGTYHYGFSLTLTATANNGYHFTHWTKDGNVVSSQANFTIRVTENAHYVAHFSRDMYYITVTANPTQGGIVSGEAAYQYGESCTVTAFAANGYHFVRWTKNGVQVSTDEEYTFTVTEDAVLIGYFALDQYQIEASANPSNAGSVSGAGTYSHGSTATLTATANTGYAFVHWTKNGNVVSTSASYSFTVTESAAYVAHFTSGTHHVTTSVTPFDSGQTSGAGVYAHGAQCTVTATPNEGYVFVKWIANGVEVSTNPSYTFSVTEDTHCKAYFTEKSCIVTASVDPEEGGTITGTGTYTYGSTVTLTVVLNDEYEFVNWTENGEVVSEEETFTFVVEDNRDFVAHVQHVDGINEQGDIEVTVFPNPARFRLTVETEEPVNLFEIYTLNGTLVYSEKNCSNRIVTDVQHFAIGTYIIRLTTDSAVVMKRFVKE